MEFLNKNWSRNEVDSLPIHTFEYLIEHGLIHLESHSLLNPFDKLVPMCSRLYCKYWQVFFATETISGQHPHSVYLFDQEQLISAVI